MTVTEADLLTRARVLMDRNLGASDEPLIDEGEENALSLDALLRANIERAARIVAEGAPTYLLQDVMKDGTGQQIVWDATVTGAGRITLPADFLRLVWFKMSDWRYGLTTAITPDHPLYAAQRSAFAGLRGSSGKPVLVLLPSAGTERRWSVEFYSSASGSATLEALTYVAVPKLSSGNIELAPLLVDAVAAEMAALSLTTLGDTQGAGAMQQVAKTLMRIAEEK